MWSRVSKTDSQKPIKPVENQKQCIQCSSIFSIDTCLSKEILNRILLLNKGGNLDFCVECDKE